jgi:hypothetical protein
MGSHYKKMLAGKFSGVNGYYGEKSNDWLALKPGDGNPYLMSEWKFHLSVDGRDVQKAWDIMVDTLMADRDSTHKAKVANPETLRAIFNPGQDNEYYTGKTMTLYPKESTDPAHYKKLLTDIESKFRAAGIREGLDISTDRKVPGSRYLHYANHRGRDVRRPGYNPSNRPDPYLDFSIDMPDTPVKPAAGGLMGFLQRRLKSSAPPSLPASPP